MITSWKHVTRWMSVSFSALFLIVLLAACGNSGNSSAATPTPKPPTATPTAAATAAPAAPLQTYTGTGFTIQYPQSWKVQNSQGAIVFTDAQQDNTVTIVTAPNPGGSVSAAQQLKLGLNALAQTAGISNAQPVSLPATTTIAGETWAQSGITGTAKTNGVAVPGELIGLADNHPANSPTTKVFNIYYGGPTLTFQVENTSVFQPMLQTFKFTA